jgi:hypothetical protein
MVREDLFVTLAEVIAEVDDLPGKSMIYAESLAPWATAFVADGSARPDEMLPYAFLVAAGRAAIGRGAPSCPWRRRAVLSRRV